MASGQWSGNRDRTEVRRQSHNMEVRRQSHNMEVRRKSHNLHYEHQIPLYVNNSFLYVYYCHLFFLYYNISMENQDHLGFYKHGNLPHFDNALALQFITFVLSDAAPRQQKSRSIPLESENGEAFFQLIDNELDRCRGTCLLRKKEYAAEVVAVIQDTHDLAIDLMAWVIMPNHVHLLIRQHDGIRLGDVICKIKSRSARRINLRRGSSGKVWQIGFFDRLMRCDGHMWNTIEYIHNNPVAAGLVPTQKDWPFSSIHGFNRYSLIDCLRN